MNELATRFTTLLDTMTQLIALLESENAALAAYHPEVIAQSVERKQLLTMLFERQMQQIGPIKEALAKMPELERRRFTATAERFRTVGHINQVTIDGARRAAERVVSHIVDAVRKQSNMQPSVYARPSTAVRRMNSRPLSVNINQTF